jgi:uncharacterized membrane protein YjjP (DUF1212 family)
VKQHSIVSKSLDHFSKSLGGSEISPSYRARNTFFVLMGVAALLLKSWFSDSLSDLAFSYVGNLSVSFAVYFIVRLATVDKLSPAFCAIVALLIVQLFEATNGFGVMANVYDRFDFVANALGVALGVAVDVITSRLSLRRTTSD